MGVKQSQLKQDGKTVWCLLKAKMALSSEEFERFLRQQTDASASSRERIRLYEVVQRADRQRQAMQAHYQAQFDACITTGSIIQQRRDQYPVVWLRFQTAYNKLMNLRGKSAVANTEEWRKFTQVAHEFYPIAPKYVEYQAALRRVEEKFEMTPPGLIRRDTTSRPG